MPLIDEAGARAISKWVQEKKRNVYDVTILSEPPLVLRVDSEIEEANLRMVLMKNRIKFNIEEIKNISPN